EVLGIPAGIFAGATIGGQPLGAVGLAAGSGLAAWVEWGLLKRSLRRRIGPVGAGLGAVARMFVAALAAAAAGWGAKLIVLDVHPVVTGIVVVASYGIVYFAVAGLLRLEEVQGLATRLRRMLRR